MKNKMLKMAMMVVSGLVLLTSAVSARNEIGNYAAKGVVYDGVESSAGYKDAVSGFHYGNTFVLASVVEAESRHLSVSVNSQEVFKGVGVTGGAWSVVVFNDGAHIGTVYGEIVSGEIQDIISEKGELIGKQTLMELRATGGTGIFNNEWGQGIKGTLIMTTDLLTKTKRTTAIETLNF